MTDRRRIGVDLPVDLVERLDRQAELMRIGRSDIIDTACRRLLIEWEQYDREYGLPPGAGR